MNKNLPAVNTVLYADCVASTQAVAKLLAERYFPGNTVIIAKTQSQGRGQFDRNWESNCGGLYMSLLLRPKSQSNALSDLSILTAEAISDALTVLGVRTKIKHPNDVLAFEPKRKKFFKIAGILVDSSSSGGKADWAVLGIGVNLLNQIPQNIQTATALNRIIKERVSAERFLEIFFIIFWNKYLVWEISAMSRGQN